MQVRILSGVLSGDMRGRDAALLGGGSLVDPLFLLFVAQWIERKPAKLEVMGSSPIRESMRERRTGVRGELISLKWWVQLLRRVLGRGEQDIASRAKARGKGI